MSKFRKMTFLKVLTTIAWADGEVSQSEINIFKNKNIIKKRQKELESKKIITDIELIKTFPDTISISGNSDGRGSNFFNSMISRLSIKAKKKIISEN